LNGRRNIRLEIGEIRMVIEIRNVKVEWTSAIGHRYEVDKWRRIGK
jgi:hypothetical protein